MLVVFKAALLGGLILGTISFAFKLHYLSRAFIVAFIIINLALLTLERFIIRQFSRSARRRGLNYRWVVIVGTDAGARDIAERIQCSRTTGSMPGCP